jgi:hypothetical protein
MFVWQTSSISHHSHHETWRCPSTAAVALLSRAANTAPALSPLPTQRHHHHCQPHLYSPNTIWTSPNSVRRVCNIQSERKATVGVNNFSSFVLVCTLYRLVQTKPFTTRLRVLEEMHLLRLASQSLGWRNIDVELVRYHSSSAWAFRLSQQPSPFTPLSQVAVVIHRSTHTTQDKHTTQSIGSSDQFTVHDFNKLALDVMHITIVIPDAYVFVLCLELLLPSPFIETHERNKQNWAEEGLVNYCNSDAMHATTSIKADILQMMYFYSRKKRSPINCRLHTIVLKTHSKWSFGLLVVKCNRVIILSCVKWNILWQATTMLCSFILLDAAPKVTIKSIEGHERSLNLFGPWQPYLIAG